jgi:hypothetical protein
MKIKKRKTSKRNPRVKTGRLLRRKNPTWKIKKALTPEEVNTLFVISGKYESPNILLSAYDEDTEEWDMDLVAKAMIATLEDGGNKFTVPLIGGQLERKIQSLFVKVLENDEKLNMNTQMDLHESGI